MPLPTYYCHSYVTSISNTLTTSWQILQSIFRIAEQYGWWYRSSAIKITSCVNLLVTLRPLKNEALHSVETLGNQSLATHRHILLLSVEFTCSRNKYHQQAKRQYPSIFRTQLFLLWFLTDIPKIEIQLAWCYKTTFNQSPQLPDNLKMSHLSL